jgi:hypothetical protein
MLEGQEVEMVWRRDKRENILDMPERTLSVLDQSTAASPCLSLASVAAQLTSSFSNKSRYSM